MARVSATNERGETSAQLRRKAKKLRKHAARMDSASKLKWSILADAIELEHEANAIGRRGRGKAFREMTAERRKEIASKGGSTTVAKHGLRVGASQLQTVTSKAGKASAAALHAMPEAERRELIRLRNAKSWETRRRNKAMKEMEK